MKPTDLCRETRQRLGRDEKAFEEVVRLYSSWLYNLAYKFTRDHHRSLDLVQETFLHIHRRLDRYDQSRPFGPWFRTVATRYCINCLRKYKNVETPVDVSDDLGFFQSDHRGTDPLERREEIDLIREATGGLPENYRVVLTLMYHESLPVQEIAQIMEVPENTVKTWLRRARNEVKEKLQRHSFKELDS